MNALKNKIQSQRGASITFALLLFLVCAVISSIVIVAATAVGGRASKMAELDQRYYAVNSAAELLRDVLEEQKVVVTTVIKEVAIVDQDEQVSNTQTLPATTTVTLNGVPTDDTTSLVTTAAMILAGIGEVTIPGDPLSLTVTSGITDPATQSALSVKMSPTLDSANQKLTIDVSNATNLNGVYTLGLVFKANFTQDNNKSTTFGAPIPTTDASTGKIIEGKYTRKRTVETMKVSTIQWKLIDLQTVVAATTGTKPATGG